LSSAAGYDEGMNNRKLRIAFSATCGIICLLLIALWVRSYWVAEELIRARQTVSETTVRAVYSIHGTLCFARQTGQTTDEILMYTSHLTKGWTYKKLGRKPPLESKFSWRYDSKVFLLQFPTWLPVPFLAVAAGIPWIRLKWKFSLRTLLIAMTLVAVALGAVIYASK
jgi:hypothetical protein